MRWVPHLRSGWWEGGYLGYLQSGLDGRGWYPRYPPTRSGWGIPPTRSVCCTPQPGLDGVPPPTRSGWWEGYPGYTPDQVWIRQSSTASTCYAAGGVPLVFMQENFLVAEMFTSYNSLTHCRTHERNAGKHSSV